MTMCRHKMKILKCNECNGMFCPSCIQLEIHKCSFLDNKIKTEREILEKNLVKVVALKIQPI